MRLRIECLAINDWKLGAFDVGNEITLRAARDHRDLYSRFAERGEIFSQLELLTGGGSRENLHRRYFFRRLGGEPRDHALWSTLGRCRRGIDLRIAKASRHCFHG